MASTNTAASSVPQRLGDAIAKVEQRAAGGGVDPGLVTEVSALAAELNKAMADIRAIGAAHIPSVHIPDASGELDAIVETTAAATGVILQACEQVEAAAGSLTGEALSTAVTDATTMIYEACSFQDLTGQRITKVVSALKAIDDRVARICELLDLKAEDAAAAPEPEPDDDSRLLNGPAMPDAAMSQDDIDRILDGLD